MIKLRFGLPLALAAALVFGIAGASAGAHPAAKPHVCSGTLKAPGVLKGTYKHGVIVKGACEVNKGPAHVIGTLTVTKGSVLGASFGANHSRLAVNGDLVVDKGATVFLGCNTTEFPCVDDPNPSAPTLSSHGSVSGSIIENNALGVVMHNSTIGKDVTETGGGGGLTCTPPKTGIWAQIMVPVYSAYEDSSIGGDITISGVHTCFISLARDTIRGNTTINSNDTKDPDAIEVLSNKINKNLSCKGNTHPSGEPDDTLPIWDSADAPPTFALYPRVSEPNTVGGKRSGQCVKGSPIAADGPPASKKF